MKTQYRQTDAASGLFGEGIHAIKSVYAASKPLWVYVLDGDFCLWVDAGIDVTPRSSVIPYLRSHAAGAWEKAQLAIITHADVDHFGGLRALKTERPDTLVMAHHADREWIESPEAVMRDRYLMHVADGIGVPPARQDTLNERGGGGGKVDIALSGNECIHLGNAGNWRVLHTPGHSAGHLVLWEAERRLAIIGDAALDWGVPNVEGELLAPPPYYDCDAYRSTIEMLRKLEADTVFTSHYGILDRNRAEEFYTNSLEAMTALERALAESLREHSEGLQLSALCAAAGSRSPVWEEALWPGLADPLSAHLKRHLSAGTIERVLRDGAVHYRWH